MRTKDLTPCPSPARRGETMSLLPLSGAERGPGGEVRLPAALLPLGQARLLGPDRARLAVARVDHRVVRQREQPVLDAPDDREEVAGLPLGVADAAGEEGVAA